MFNLKKIKDRGISILKTYGTLLVEMNSFQNDTIHILKA